MESKIVTVLKSFKIIDGKFSVETRDGEFLSKKMTRKWKMDNCKTRIEVWIKSGKELVLFTKNGRLVSMEGLNKQGVAQFE